MTVLMTLVVFDDRVARQLALVCRRGPDRELLGMHDWLSSLVSTLLVVTRDQSIDHAPMLVFTAVAVLLVIFMVRT